MCGSVTFVGEEGFSGSLFVNPERDRRLTAVVFEFVCFVLDEVVVFFPDF